MLSWQGYHTITINHDSHVNITGLSCYHDNVLMLSCFHFLSWKLHLLVVELQHFDPSSGFVYKVKAALAPTIIYSENSFFLNWKKLLLLCDVINDNFFAWAGTIFNNLFQKKNYAVLFNRWLRLCNTGFKNLQIQ
jgi:hypothetical protein